MQGMSHAIPSPEEDWLNPGGIDRFDQKFEAFRFLSAFGLDTESLRWASSKRNLSMTVYMYDV